MDAVLPVVLVAARVSARSGTPGRPHLAATARAPVREATATAARAAASSSGRPPLAMPAGAPRSE